MWDTFLNAVMLFLKGKLFRDPGAVVRQTLIGNAIAAVLVVVLAKLGLSLLVVVPIVGIISGAIQPWLFKDLKYA